MSSRIEDLERRVRQDPASIAFGALAEEYRRAGRLDDAVAACRTGLERHPSYLSARVTLGRALQELRRIADARREFEYVLSLAPDNLAAIRGLAELDPTGPESPVSLEPVKREQQAAPEPDLRALDASLEGAVSSAAAAERAAQIERLEIWLAKLEQEREALRDDSR